MGYVGAKPSAVPLTSADITDGIITSAKIADGTIANADINSTAGITLNKLSGNPSFRNIVINGDMQVAQRSTSVASITADGYYTCDRWNVGLGSFGTWTQSQSTDVPSGYGFAKSIKMDCTTAQASPASSSLIVLEQKFEGQNLQYLRFGTANARQLILSFWCKHTKTGTNIVELIDADNSDAVSGSYTQSVSNTWEFKTITFPAKTSGAFDNDNASSLRLRFIMGAGTDFTSGTLATTWIDTIVNANRYVGQVNNADSTSNDFIITGVQLEAGTSATDFEFLPIDVSLGRCQRYYAQLYSSVGTSAYSSTVDLCVATDYDGSQLFIMKDLPTTMRTIPSIVQTTGTNFLLALRNGTNDNFDGFNGTGNAGYDNIAIFTSGGEGYTGTSGVSARLRVNNTGYRLGASAEL